MAVEISNLTLKHQGGRTSGAQPVALASTTTWPKIKAKVPNAVAQLDLNGVKAAVATGAAQLVAKGDVDA